MDSELRRHIDDGLSGGATALAMGLTNGQVVGRASRKGWRFGSAPGHKRKKSGGANRGSFGSRFMPDFRKPKITIEQVFPYKEATVVPDVELSPLNLTFWQLRDSPIISECRYITAEAPVVTYCGLPTVDDSSWCRNCMKLVYQNRAA